MNDIAVEISRFLREPWLALSIKGAPKRWVCLPVIMCWNSFGAIWL
jgi:hypothetical protein